MKTSLVLFFLFVLSIQVFSTDREARTIRLDALESNKLRAGLQLGYPVSGLTAGYHITNTMEINVLVGSLLNFNSLSLGSSLLFTLYNLQIENEIFPLNAGPVCYIHIKSDSIQSSIGGLFQIEYDFEIPLNLYMQTGMLVNLGDQRPLFTWPFAFGVRYIF